MASFSPVWLLIDLAVISMRVGRCLEVTPTAFNRPLALMEAAFGGHLDVVHHLSERDTDLNASLQDGKTALMLSAWRGHVEVVRYLTEHGAAVNAKTFRGWTALMWAAAEGHIQVVRHLVECGAGVNVHDSFGGSALLHAAENNHAQVVQHLVNCGARVDAANRKGETTLRVAAKRGHQAVVRILLPFVRSTHRPLGGETINGPFSVAPFDIELLEFANTGNVGGDYRAKWLDADVVIKLFVPDASVSTFKSEVRLWQQLRHPNVIKLYGACDDHGLQLFVCEYAPKGSLLEYLDSLDAQQRTPWKFLHEAALGLAYLHERKIVHGDLRCSNILIGSDRLAKLTNFGLSGPSRMGRSTSNPGFAGSIRWRAPELLTGKEASLASDVYSLGICIVEATTGRVPWANVADILVEVRKREWAPELKASSRWEPPGLSGDTRELVSQMCCRDPRKRATIASAVNELERFAANEGVQFLRCSQSTPDPECTVEAYDGGKTAQLWASLAGLVSDCDAQICEVLEFEELRALFEKLRASTYRPAILARFHETLIEFRGAVTTMKSAGQARIMQLSSSRAINSNIHAFHRRVELLWSMLGDSVDALSAREVRWNQRRSRRVELFVSEACNAPVLLNVLESTEERSAFLALLKEEFEVHACNYTNDQLAAMRQACETIVGQLDALAQVTTAPEWFIPWYELEIDERASLGKGGFASVHRAKWLGSSVVVKQIALDGALESRWGCPDSVVSSASLVSSKPAAKPNLERKAEAIAMLKGEADI